MVGIHHKVVTAVAIHRKDRHKADIRHTVRAALNRIRKDPTARDLTVRAHRLADMHHSRVSYNHHLQLDTVPTMIPRVSPKTSHLMTRASVVALYARFTLF